MDIRAWVANHRVILNFMIPPTRVGRLSADTLPTHMSNHFFLFHRYLYGKFTDWRISLLIDGFEMSHSFVWISVYLYDIHNHAESIQYTNEYVIWQIYLLIELLKNPFAHIRLWNVSFICVNFRISVDTHNRAEAIQYTNEYAHVSIKCLPT